MATLAMVTLLFFGKMVQVWRSALGYVQNHFFIESKIALKSCFCRGLVIAFFP